MTFDSKPDQLLERIAAMERDFAEFDAAFPDIGQSARQLFQSMELHARAGNQLTQRAAKGKDIDAQVASLREVFRTYEPLLRQLAVNCIRVAEISKRIHGKLTDLNTPLENE